MNNQTTFNPFAQNLAIVKSYFKRPLVLALGILYLVSIVLSFASVFTMGTSISDMYSTMFEMTGVYEEMPSEMSGLFSNFTSQGFLTTVFAVAMIPSLVITAFYATAYFIIHFKSKNESESSSPKAGFTILFVLAILNLIYAIFTALLFVLFIALFIVGAIAISQDPTVSSSDSTVATVMFSVCALIFAGIAAILLIYTISNFNYIKSAKNSLSSATLSCKGAGTYGVMSIIFGITALLSVLPSLVMAPLMSSMSQMMPSDFAAEFPAEIFSSMSSLYLISGIMSVLSVAIMIIDAIIALGYKKHINNITNGFYNPEPVFDAPSQPAPAYDYANAVTQQPMQAENVEPVVQPQAQFEPVVFGDNSMNPNAKHCPRCGTVAKENDVFCNACGTKL